MQQIVTHFEKYFDIILADTPELLYECRKLRFQVLCIENHYLKEEENKNSLEEDTYDNKSAHCLILHKSSGLYAATVRLVLPTQNNPSVDFPIESFLTEKCREEYNKLMHAPREHLGEISRFMISKQFRQRVGESNVFDGINNDFGMLSPKMKRQFAAQISLGLFKAIFKMSHQHDIQFWLALMEPRLIRLLARVGIHFNHLSESIEFFGDRHVCFENTTEILMGIKRQRPDIWDFVTENGTYDLKGSSSQHISTPAPVNIISNISSIR